MIDLHLHTTASDGQLAPAQLVARVHAAGVTTFAVTDHDTVAGLDEARAAANALGLRLVNGIEITAVEDERDVHVLGYFFDPSNSELTDFLAVQRADRVRRVHEIAARLADAGAPVDPVPIALRGLEGGRSVGRPHLAAALVAAGHVSTTDEAFDRYLGRGRTAFVARRGASVADVVRVVAQAGGVTSLAHPGLTRLDDRIPAFAVAGLTAIEAIHSDHDDATALRYRGLAARLGMAISGGSDFHGETSHHRVGLGVVGLKNTELDALERRKP